MKWAARAGLAALPFALLVSAQDLSDIKLELTAKDFTFTEGPAWSPKENFLIFSDIPSDRLLKWAPGRAAEVYRAGANGPSGNAFDAQSRLYTCETRARRVTRTDLKGKIEVLADQWEGKKLNAPNGIAVSRNGHAYFTDPAFGAQSDRRELDFYGVYEIPPKGPMKLVAKWTTRPNGIALSPNGRTLYVAGADEHVVKAYDLDRDGGASNERVFISNIDGAPGGLHTDEKGDLYVAANRLLVYDASGKPIGAIEVKGRPSNCAFGMPDGKTLFITARQNVYRTLLDVRGAY